MSCHSHFMLAQLGLLLKTAIRLLPIYTHRALYTACMCSSTVTLMRGHNIHYYVRVCQQVLCQEYTATIRTNKTTFCTIYKSPEALLYVSEDRLFIHKHMSCARTIISTYMFNSSGISLMNRNPTREIVTVLDANR